jgi:hypothetical protein
MNEQYIFLGIQQNCWFFIHKITNKEFKKETSYQLMNCLINDNFIVDENTHCIIYEFDIEFNAIIISKNNLTFHKENLEEQYNKLLSADRSADTTMLVYEYDYNNNVFYTKDVAYIIEKSDNNIDIKNISYIKCLKPLG